MTLMLECLHMASVETGNRIRHGFLPRKEVLKRLVETYGARTHRLAYQILGDASEAEDVTQEVFIKLVRDRKDLFRFGSLDAWVYRLTVNAALDSLRKRQTRQAYVAQPVVRQTSLEKSGGMDPSRIAAMKEVKEAVHQAIEMLPEEERVCLLLHDREGLSVREIEQIVGAAKSTVYRNVCAARKKLKTVLRDQVFEEDRP